MAAPDRYGAFISYRHVEPDRAAARWLQSALETYRLPAALVRAGHPARLGRVFRDEEELAASPDLSARIDEALARADALVLVCSPRTPASRWVEAEVQRFIGLDRADRIFVVLADGEPAQSLPPALLALGREPLAADLRPQAGERPREQRRLALLKLVAGLLGLEFDALRRRDDERRQRRLALLAAGGTLLAGLFAALALAAVQQWQRAERELRTAQAQRLATMAQMALAQATAPDAADQPLAPDLQRGALLALESLRLEPGWAADAVLREALRALAPERLGARLPADAPLPTLDDDGRLGAAPAAPVAASTAPDVADAADPELLGQSPDGRWRLRRAPPEPGDDPELREALRVERVGDGRLLARLGHEWPLRQAGFSADGRWLFSVTGAASADATDPGATMLVGHTLRVWDSADWSERTRVSLAADGGIDAVLRSPDGRWLATVGREPAGGTDRPVRLWPLPPDRLQAVACTLLQRNLSPSEWHRAGVPGAPRATCPGRPVVSE